MLFSYVLSGVATVEDFRTDRPRGLGRVRDHEVHDRLRVAVAKFVTVAILAGFSSVILVMLLGQSRVFYSMSRDGLVPKVFSDVHPTLQDAVQVEHGVLRASRRSSRAFIPGDIVGEMTSIGTLFAFMLVCAGVWIMRVRRPDIPRGFTVPALPVVAIARHRRLRRDDLRPRLDELAAAGVWLAIGLVIYFTYGISHSRQNVQPAARGRRASEDSHSMMRLSAPRRSSTGWPLAKRFAPKSS